MVNSAKAESLGHWFSRVVLLNIHPAQSVVETKVEMEETVGDIPVLEVGSSVTAARTGGPLNIESRR